MLCFLVCAFIVEKGFEKEFATHIVTLCRVPVLLFTPLFLTKICKKSHSFYIGTLVQWYVLGFSYFISLIVMKHFF